MLTNDDLPVHAFGGMTWEFTNVVERSRLGGGKSRRRYGICILVRCRNRDFSSGSELLLSIPPPNAT